MADDEEDRGVSPRLRSLAQPPPSTSTAAGVEMHPLPFSSVWLVYTSFVVAIAACGCTILWWWWWCTHYR